MPELKIGDRFYSVGNFYVTLNEITDTDYVFIDDGGSPWGGSKKDIGDFIVQGILTKVSEVE
ncbi:hypothetical protein CIW83_09340 [Tissierella sp. P1]|uniref:hypothetical protein n=1 Tax=Tissierella sp. P1 TaxID=1280483 RepID=UPI000B9FB329|nr:hypothetical protein [Tissierella sp. P1]OZV12292.1 hypothetical protein CIW83_09340 [Tissierella sp. P1]